MKKTSIYVALLALITVFSGCGKDELDINLTEKIDGNLSITFTESDGSPIANQKVLLVQYDGILEDTKTDANGVAAFNNIIRGSYSIVAEEVTDGNAKYNVQQAVQVISNVTKTYTFTPSDYSGSVEITVIDWWNGVPASGKNVVIFRSEDLKGAEFQDALDAALFSGITNADGIVKFEKLPLDIYGVMVYTNSTDYSLDEMSFDIYYKDQEREVTFYSEK